MYILGICMCIIYTYMYTCIHIYIHTYIHTYILDIHILGAKTAGNPPPAVYHAIQARY